MKKLYLIDGMSVVFRAYYAMEATHLAANDGLPTGAILGFTNIINNFLKKFSPQNIAVAFDCRQPTFRHKLYKEYKANRREFPKELGLQLPFIKEFLNLMGIITIEMPGFEADDIIGTLAKEGSESGMEVFCFTSDKDFYQLLDANVKILRGAKSGKGFEVIAAQDVKQKFGVCSDEVVDFLALVGDVSDNVPGVRGIGEKTAVGLIERFGSVENIYESIERVEKERVRQLLIAGKAEAFLSKELVTIDTSVELGIGLGTLTRGKADYDGLQMFFAKLGFRQGRALDLDKPAFGGLACDDLLPQDFDLLGNYIDIRPKDAPLGSISTYSHEYILVDIDNVNGMLAEIGSGSVLCINLETDTADRNNNNIVGISFCNSENKAYYLPLDLRIKEKNADVDKDNGLFDAIDSSNDTVSLETPVKALEEHSHSKSIEYFVWYILEDLKIILENDSILKIGHNLKETAYVLKRYNINLASILFDSAISGYLLQNEAEVSLRNLSEKYLFYSPIVLDNKNASKEENFGLDDLSLENKSNYFAENVNIIFRLYKLLPNVLSKDNLYYVAENIEFPLVEILTDMEYSGISIDIPKLTSIATNGYAEIANLKQKIFEIVGEEFNLDSPKQVADALFNKMGLYHGNNKNQHTDLQVLTELADEHPIADLILKYRKLAKIKSAYIDSLPKLVNKNTNRIHTTFNQTITNTGRLSSTDPNLQNIPIRTDIGKEVRAAFIAKDAQHLILSADYSQIELRIMAYLSNDKRLIEAFKNNIDVHTSAACAIYNCTPQEVNNDMRRTAKTINFGIIYGQGGFSLSQQLKIPRSKADAIITDYFNIFTGVKSYIINALSKVRQTGYAETITGRKRYFPNINHKNYNIRSATERAAINMPIQGTASDLIKTAMINIYQTLKHKGLKTKMLLQVHDELVFEVPKDELNAVTEIVTAQMLYSLPLGDVPLDVSVGVGKNWLEAHS